ncbi:MAG TPA: FUSC family membrane protein [Chryseolinea sp.]
MTRGIDYLKEIQKFTTSQYWNSGVRITTGVLIPMLIMVHQDWLSFGIPFLWGALFVSLTDTPGPIHHRRNGMLAAITLNTCVVIITGFLHSYEALLLIQVLTFSFFLALLGIYGVRAGAVGTLALVVMLLNMSPFRDHDSFLLDAALTAGGGIWYAIFSLTLYRLQPYRLVEQALGESILQLADYIGARALFYKKGSDITACFNRVMQEQVEVLKTQNQLRELIFTTRLFVTDPSPKSRSLMMVFLESLDLFEESMHTYQDYKLLQQHTRHTDLLPKFHNVILKLETELDRIGLSVQAGIAVKRLPDFTNELNALSHALDEHQKNSAGPAVSQTLNALELTVENIRSIVDRLSKLVLYTQMQIDVNPTLQGSDAEMHVSSNPSSKPLRASLLLENLNLRSNNFRYAVRLTLAMAMGYLVSMFFAVSHTYWVLLTIVTILKPVYNVTRRRNIQRVTGTLAGVLVASGILYLVTNNTVLLVLLIICMLMAYSFLRINYLGFVIFLTTYVIITFHFLNPVEFKNLIGERLIDTLIGSLIAALAARFIFPVWKHENIKKSMEEILSANKIYFEAASQQLTPDSDENNGYTRARTDAIIALTNLSDNFQQMLTEPGHGKLSSHVHQFVIASHALTSRISALSSLDLRNVSNGNLNSGQLLVTQMLNDCIENLNGHKKNSRLAEPQSFHSVNPISIIYSLSRELRSITQNIAGAKE